MAEECQFFLLKNIENMSLVVNNEYKMWENSWCYTFSAVPNNSMAIF